MMVSVSLLSVSCQLTVDQILWFILFSQWYSVKYLITLMFAIPKLARFVRHSQWVYVTTYSQTCLLVLLLLTSVLILFIFSLAVLGFELGALDLLDRHSTTWATPTALLCFSYVSDLVLSFFPGPGSSYLWPPMYHGPQAHTTTQHSLLVEVGVLLIFYQVILKLWSSQSPTPK
jgi:hypothetical protein